MSTLQQRQSTWRYHFIRSTYVTTFTDWFMTLAGKATEIVLYATVLYSCAQLYPGVNLPDKLSLSVFLVQMGALDIGGLSLAKLAKQARADNNADGARQAETLSRWLIGIMLIGVVTVGIGHVVAMPALASTIIQIVLVLARSIGSVLYGRVIHSLRDDETPETPSQITPTIQPVVPQFHQVKISPIVPGKQLQSFSRLPLHLVSVSDETPAVSLETPQTEIATSSDETSLEAAIATLLAMNSSLSSRELASALNRPHSTVYRCMKHLAQLKKQSA